MLFLFLFLFLACSSSSGLRPSDKAKSEKPTIIKAEPKESGSKDIGVDTIQLQLVSEEMFPPITDEHDTNLTSLFPKVLGASKKAKNRYKIALFLPMIFENTTYNSALNENNSKFAHFYAGIKLAAQSHTEVPIDVKVYHTDRNIKGLDLIIESLKNDLPDLIVGPYENEYLSKLADFAKKYEVIMISPWKSSTRITEDNPFYLQMRPNITTYYEKILEHASFNFNRDEICIIAQRDGSDDTKIQVLQELNEKVSDVPLAQALKTLKVKDAHLYEGDSIIFRPLLERGVKAFILPQYSAREESFVYSCLRKLNGEKGQHEFYIYTLPVVINSDKVDLNIFKNLNIRVCEFRFPDPRNPEVKAFQKSYFDEYGWLPTEDAYYGFDLMNYMTNGLVTYGSYFPWEMNGSTVSLSQMRISAVPYFAEGTTTINYLMNDELYIIEYNVDHFEVKNIR